MLVVFGSAKLLAELFERLSMPAIVGEILAGAIVGPPLLGWIAPNQVLAALADLGVMFLLFRVGLEVKSSELMRVGGAALLVAVLGVAAPFVLGAAIMLLFHAPRIEAIFVGAAMVATSVGITAQVLAARGLLHQISSRIILAAAVIDDVLGLIVLAVVTSLAGGKTDLLQLSLTAALAIGFTVVVARFGGPAMGHILPRFSNRFRSGEVQFNLAMVLLFGLALAAVWAGVAAIIGAFLAGMALSENVGQRVSTLVHGVTELLLPFFLTGIGMHLKFESFTEPSTVLLAVLIVAAAVISKLVACGLGAMSLGFANALRIGCGMVPRGEVGMVVAQIGFSMGVVPSRVYAVVVLMSIATTLLAPPLLLLSYRNAAKSPGIE